MTTNSVYSVNEDAKDFARDLIGDVNGVVIPDNDVVSVGFGGFTNNVVFDGIFTSSFTNAIFGGIFTSSAGDVVSTIARASQLIVLLDQKY